MHDDAWAYPGQVEYTTKPREHLMEGIKPSVLPSELQFSKTPRLHVSSIQIDSDGDTEQHLSERWQKVAFTLTNWLRTPSHRECYSSLIHS